MQNKQLRSLAWHKNWFKLVEINKFTRENNSFVQNTGANNWFIVS